MSNASTVNVGDKVWYADKVGSGYIIRTGQIVNILNGVCVVVQRYISTIAGLKEDVLFRFEEASDELFFNRDDVENYIARKKAEE